MMGALSSGALEGNIMPDLEAKLQIPPPYNQIISREYLMYNAAQELASLAMQAPSPAGFPGDPVSMQFVTFGAPRFAVFWLGDGAVFDTEASA